MIPLSANMENGKIMNKLIDLSSKPHTYNFNKSELEFIRNNVNTDNWKVHYCIYNKHSPSNRYFGLVIDYMSNNPRNITPKFYGMNVICSRFLNTKELEYEYENYGTRNRRFHLYWLDNVHWIIDMDRQYNVETPIKFIEACNNFNKQLNLI